MPIDEEFFELLPDTIKWEKRTGRDAWSHPTYGAPEYVEHCRVDLQYREILSPEGTETLRVATITIGTLTTLTGKPVAIGIDDRITLPGGEKPRIMDVRVVEDESGPHHITVEIGQAGGV